MKVKDLIVLLQQEDPDKQVIARNKNRGTFRYGDITVREGANKYTEGMICLEGTYNNQEVEV